MTNTKRSLLNYELERFITASRSGRRRKPDGNKIAEGTLKNYENCLRLLNDYSQCTHTELHIFQVVKMDKKCFRSRKLYWRKFYNHFREFLYRKGHFDNYVMHILKVIRALLHWLFTENGWLDHQFLPRQSQPSTRANDFEVLAPDQFKFLINNTAFRNSLSKSQN
jgi:hypothetical protein